VVGVAIDAGDERGDVPAGQDAGARADFMRVATASD
jgi:hypothetical protein